MPPLNLTWTVFGRPIKPVSFVLMVTMLVLGLAAITNQGILAESLWADIIGILALFAAGLFAAAYYTSSQTLAEYALLSAFFIWGVRLWAVILTQGLTILTKEAGYLALLWMLLAAGSWLLERADPAQRIEQNRGNRWSRQ